MAVLVMAAPLYAQSRTGGATPAAAEETVVKNGVRFVIVAPDGGALPSPLFCKQGKKYKEIKISSRTPSVRVKPENGVVNFYKEDPLAAAEADPKKAGKEVKLPPPVLSVTVPGNANKMLCIVVPNKTAPEKPQTFFLNEKDFPRKGVHIINFSPNKLVMTLSEKGDFTDKKDSTIGPFRREAGISPENSWTFKGEKDGDAMAFKLSFVPKDAKSPKDVKMLRASKFVVSSRQSQISIVVKDSNPNRETLKLMPIQLPSDSASGAED